MSPPELSELRHRLSAARASPTCSDALDNAHRLACAFRDSTRSAGRGRIAAMLANALSDLRTGNLGTTPDAFDLFDQCATWLGADPGDAADSLRESLLLDEAMAAFARLRGQPAAQPPPAPAEAPTTTIGPELFDVFALEAEEHLNTISTSLAGLRDQPGSGDRLYDLRRAIHALEGAGEAVGFRDLAALAQRTEDFLDRLDTGRHPVTPDILTLLLASHGGLNDLAVSRAPAGLPDLYADFDRANAALTAADAPSESEPITVEQHDRVPTGWLEDVIRLVGHVIVERSALEHRLTDLTRPATDLQLVADRLLTTTGQADVARDVQTAAREFAAAVADCDAYLSHQARLTGELQEKLIRLRMFPLATPADQRRRAAAADDKETLDIVPDQVRKLKELVTVESTAEKETTFPLRLPLTQAVMRGLLVRARGQMFVLRFDAIVQILRPDSEHTARALVLTYNGQEYPALSLATLLNLPGSGEPPDRSSAVIVNAGGHCVALRVDELVDVREIVVKSLGSHLRRVRGITGATILADGTVVLILNLLELIGTPADAARQ